MEPGSDVAGELVRLAEDTAWERAPERSLSVARAIYLRLPDGYRLWLWSREFAELDRGALETALV